MPVTINSDMGEAFGIYEMGDDEACMPYITHANVACGFHASDPKVMWRTVRLAKKHGIAIGAHPGLPDREGFGRREMKLSRDDVAALVTYQVGALKGFLDAEGVPLSHIKPHGALFGMAMKDEAVAHGIADVAEVFGVPLIGFAGCVQAEVYKERRVPFTCEFYADLDYDDHGWQIITIEHEAVDPDGAAGKVLRAVTEGKTTSINGREVDVVAQSICVHSDTPGRLRSRGGCSRCCNHIWADLREHRMIYEEPRFYPGGDRCIEVEFGDEMSFDLNFLVHSVTARIRECATAGIIEIIPEMASLQVSYDPDMISYQDACREVLALYRSIGSLEELELDSRMFYVPAFYFDPWTRECVDDYRAKLADKEWDGDMLVRLNGLRDLDQLRRVHSASDYWVAALGFWPGLCSLMPLDPRSRLVAPKYDPPRTWTPKGTIGHGGAITCIYPDQTPGGYQIFGRTPMPIWDREQRLAAFKDSLALFRPGDRVRFYSIDREEYDYIDGKVKDSSYKHNMVAYQRFSIKNYHA